MAWDDPEERAGGYPELPSPGQLGLAHLRPFALRVLLRILADDEVPARIKLDAAKLVVERTKETSEQEAEGTGSDAVVDLEAERLWRDLQKHS